ncbi:MAG: DNA sulfur modification protein DndD [Xenococcaceae cyanobacterium]
MIFTELILENFGAYSGRQVLNLRPEKNDRACPIILFGGMNGGGKTTIVDAIRLALYGQRAQCSRRGNLAYGEFLSQAVNSQSKLEEKTKIELVFEHVVNDAWKELRVVRTWVKNPKDGKDSLDVKEVVRNRSDDSLRERDFIVGECSDRALTNIWDEYIENLLPLGISNLFLFDGEQVKELAELDTPPSTVIEAIQSLLGLELAERLAIDLDILLNRKRKLLASKSQLATIEEIEDKIEKQKETQVKLEEKIQSILKKSEKAKKVYKQAAEKFRVEGGRIAAEKSRLDDRSKTFDVNAEQQRQELRNLSAATLPLKLITPLLEQAKKQAQTEFKVKQAEIAKEILLERDRRLLDYLSLLSVGAIEVVKIKDFLVRENESLDNQTGSLERIYLGLTEEQRKELESIIDHQLPIQTKLTGEYLDKLKEIEIEINSTQRQLAAAASPEDYQKLNDELEKAQKELVSCEAEYARVKRQGDEIERSIAQTRKELEKYSQQTIDLHNDEHIIKSVSKVQATLKLFKERLTLKKLNKLEGEVTECFRYLLHKSDLVHRVAIASESFSISLYDLQGKLVPKHRLSAGEKQLLAIAFLWGLARVSGRNLPIAIDTPLGRLDSSHRNNLVEKYFPTASHQVILLSTDTEVGENEVKLLREQMAIAREYLLKYDSSKHQTTVEEGYFW